MGGERGILGCMFVCMRVCVSVSACGCSVWAFSWEEPVYIPTCFRYHRYHRYVSPLLGIALQSRSVFDLHIKLELKTYLHTYLPTRFKYHYQPRSCSRGIRFLVRVHWSQLGEGGDEGNVQYIRVLAVCEGWGGQGARSYGYTVNTSVAKFYLLGSGRALMSDGWKALTKRQ